MIGFAGRFRFSRQTQALSVNQSTLKTMRSFVKNASAKSQKIAAKRKFASAWLPLAASIAALPLLISEAHAATGTWAGLAGNWDTTATNWTGVSGTPWDSTNGASNTSTFSTSAGDVTLTSDVFTSGLAFTNNNRIISGAQTLTLAGAAPTVSTATVNATINSTLAGTNGFTKTGRGKLTLSGLNTISGKTIIGGGGAEGQFSTISLNAAGTDGVTNYSLGGDVQIGTSGTSGYKSLELAGDNQIIKTSNLTFLTQNAGATNRFAVLYMNGATQTFASISDVGSSGAGQWFVQALSGTNVLTIDGSTSTSFGGALTQSGAGTTLAFTKAGAGTLTLTSTGHNYTGDTNVNGGTLNVTGTLTGTKVNVNGGGTLGGNGTITTSNKAFTLASLGKLDPDSGLGLRVNTGSANFDITAGVSGGNTGALLFSLGTDSDKITLTLGTGVFSTGGALGFSDFAFTQGAGFGVGTYTLFGTNKATAGLLDGSDLTGLIGGFNANLQSVGNNIVLNVVPEPGAFTALLGGVGMLLGLRRRRR